MLRFAGGARGVLWASQVAPGNENNLRLRVYGSQGGIEWRQEQPNQLPCRRSASRRRRIARATRRGAVPRRRASRASRPAIPRATSKPSPRSTARSPQAIRARAAGRARRLDSAAQFPDLADGVAGVEFIEAAVASSARGGRWVRLPGAADRDK